MPSENVSKPPGEWQTFDITLVDRHLTVIHNGKRTIDNQPVLGCTGGALWSDEFRPGPIYLQGDHTSVDYRNIVLRPVVKCPVKICQLLTSKDRVRRHRAPPLLPP